MAKNVYRLVFCYTFYYLSSWESNAISWGTALVDSPIDIVFMWNRTSVDQCNGIIIKGCNKKKQMVHILGHNFHYRYWINQIENPQKCSLSIRKSIPKIRFYFLIVYHGFWAKFKNWATNSSIHGEKNICRVVWGNFVA